MEEVVAGTVPDSCFLSSLDLIKWLMLEEQIAKDNEQPVCLLQDLHHLTLPWFLCSQAAPEMSVL